MSNDVNSSYLWFRKKQTELEYEIHQIWSPHGGQIPIIQSLLRDLLRYVFLQCGRKFGKTELAVYLMYMYALLFPNSQIYFIADTMKHAGEIVWKNRRLPDFFTKFRKRKSETIEEYKERKRFGQSLKDKYIAKVNESEMRITFNNGSFIKVDGSDSYYNADGLEPTFIVYDEFNNHDPRFHEAMDPNLRVNRAPLLIMGAPPDEPETYYEKIANLVKKLPYGKFYKKPSYTNSILYPLGATDPDFLEEYQKYEMKGELDQFQRWLLAEIVYGGGRAIFPMFKAPIIHYETGLPVGETAHVKSYEGMVKEVRKKWKDWDLVCAYDPGSSVCFGVLICAVNKRDKRIFVLDEIYEKEAKETTTGKIYPKSLDKCRAIHELDENWHRIYDHAAAWFSNEVVDQFGDNLFPCEKDVKTKNDKISLIKDIMLTDGLLTVSDKCKNFISEIVAYRKDENGKIPKENDHLIDCFRYVLNAVGYNRVMYIEALEQSDRRGYTIEDDIKQAKVAGLLPMDEYDDYDY